MPCPCRRRAELLVTLAGMAAIAALAAAVLVTAPALDEGPLATLCCCVLGLGVCITVLVCRCQGRSLGRGADDTPRPPAAPAGAATVGRYPRLVA